MTYATADDLFGGPDETEELTLPSGRVIVVRGLSVAEVRERPDNVEGEPWYVHKGVVEPQLTLEQVWAWVAKRGAAADFMVTFTKIAQLSGVAEGARKSGDESVS